MNKYLLKIETTGIEGHDELLQVLLVDFSGNIIYANCVRPEKKDNPAFRYNNLDNNLLSNFPDSNTQETIERELNNLVSGNIIYSYKLEFDRKFLKLKPHSWLDILGIISKKRRKIPNLDCYKVIPSPIYRKSLNILELMRENEIICDKEDIIELTF